VFLSSRVLTDDERSVAFAVVPEFAALERNRSVAHALVAHSALEHFDALVGGFAREAFAAYADGTYLLLRGAGQLAESKAAEVFCAREEPSGWLNKNQPLDEESVGRLRRSLQTIPLEAAGMYIDAALNHLANAVIRFAYESGFSGGEVKKLGLRIKQPVTVTGWTSWRKIAQSLIELEASSALVPSFMLAKALVACHRDPHLTAVIDYRDMLVHRGVPADLWTQAINRGTGYKDNSITLHLPMTAPPATVQIDASRETMARALVVCRALEDAVHVFVPRWARHLGFDVEITDAGVELSWSAQQSPVAVPASVVHLPGGSARVTMPFSATLTIRPRVSRDPNMFLA
jgi:hypothetical protein